MVNEKHVCCICKGIFFGYGNNPEPIESEGRCCDDCNNSHVIATRLGNLRVAPTEEDVSNIKERSWAKMNEGETKKKELIEE